MRVITVSIQTGKWSRLYFSRPDLLLDHPQPIFQVQFAWTTIIVQAECRVRLLLRLNDNRPRSERVHRASGNVNHVADF